ncbi:hypothetical protein L249_8669 [Ophiocordyceps polyrhachis-furcata BCC 54312]|uniref:Uncharacterized protein n=1 Tax=Ophiocordyceps polyrhachis-furcata BCC 54312 TaxID=1330021 RepID=A0A367L6X9_9HYPO|nr:hypothetical protein L249_8669 [Ophiocordyceps polyrhachis-furcata BCC 54312]
MLILDSGHRRRWQVQRGIAIHGGGAKLEHGSEAKVWSRDAKAHVGRGEGQEGEGSVVEESCRRAVGRPERWGLIPPLPAAQPGRSGGLKRVLCSATPHRCFPPLSSTSREKGECESES